MAVPLFGTRWRNRIGNSARQSVRSRCPQIAQSGHAGCADQVTRLALVESTEAQIVTITGSSLRGVRSILDAHYLHRDPALAESAIRKLETRTKSPD
jgi:hypothetical protein